MAPGRCYNCQKNCDTKRCTGCQQASYCSKTCQRTHWHKHKENCIQADSSVHELSKVCLWDIFPARWSAVSRDYGFDNVRIFHQDVLWSSENMTAETILLGTFQLIIKDVGNLEFGDTIYVFNAIDASKKMIVKAVENNELDDFIHRYIRNVLSRHGKASPKYLFGWIWNRLVIGPTRTDGLTEQQIQEMRQKIYNKYYGSVNSPNCCCLTLRQAPIVEHPSRC
ncbi:uncharacterized protein LOC114576395 [Exaiptasia diaphana]|uniref:MYND-type domain-containing protein n=1 Tax=Exaiptasia diaphana TaxID=2652724 RepID=A0A913YU91_EXADI|nr:uncharacterized protein LOC114576395 [Exaiptasia diaphana]